MLERDVQPVLLLVGHPGAVIANEEADELSVHCRPHLGPAGGVLQRVADQVCHHALEQPGIGGDCRQVEALDVDPAEVVERRSEAFLNSRTPTLRHGLTDLVALDRLDDATLVERRSTAACVLREEAGRLLVLLGDRELRMPPRLAPVLELVRDRGAFRVAELEPWLDAESRLVVVRRLVREGLLRIAG